MRRKYKIAIFSILLFSLLVTNLGIGFLENSDVYAQGNVKKIQSRGLVFNTGIHSDQIRFVKDFFRVRGASNVPWGYDYDSRTKELVRQFQREKGLSADGIAGNSTIQKMNEEIVNKNYYNIGPREPNTNTSGDLIIINKSSNTLHHLKNGKVYKSYAVATGKNSSYTPDGRHKVVVKYKNPAWGGGGVSDPIPGGAANNPLGKRWIGLSVGGGGKYGMHGNASPNSIGKYASLGCVRMHNYEVEKFYDEVRIGTPVWIGSESTLQGYGVKFEHSHGTNTGQVKPPANKDYPKANIKLNGAEVELKDSAINKNGTTYYPFRELLELVGAEVSWDQETRTAKGILDETSVEFPINSNEYRVNGEKMNLPKGQKTFIEKDKTYIPIRYLMEAFGYTVDWDQESQTVLLTIEIIEEEPDEPEEEIIIDTEEDLTEDGNIEEIENIEEDNHEKDLNKDNLDINKKVE